MKKKWFGHYFSMVIATVSLLEQLVFFHWPLFLNVHMGLLFSILRRKNDFG